MMNIEDVFPSQKIRNNQAIIYIFFSLYEFRDLRRNLKIQCGFEKRKQIEGYIKYNILIQINKAGSVSK